MVRISTYGKAKNANTISWFLALGVGSIGSSIYILTIGMVVLELFPAQFALPFALLGSGVGILCMAIGAIAIYVGLETE